METSSVATKSVMLTWECQIPLRLKCGQLGNTIATASRSAITLALLRKDTIPHNTVGTARMQAALIHKDTGSDVVVS